ncbi:MAG: superoxide dismutase [Bacteroidetes bacterium]|nr:superoxide dismutase [Bacteroidota bacterium]
MKSNRREFLKNASILTVSGVVSGSLLNNIANAKPLFSIDGVGKNHFVLPKLPYSYDSLEPFIDKQTMEIHHSKHHQAYIDKLNKAIDETKISVNTIEELCENVSKLSNALRNNGGGHYNHSLFWKLMKPNSNGKPIGNLADSINKEFGTFENFKLKFSDAAKGIFGSGWAWLVINKSKKLEIGITANQDNPLMDIAEFKGYPILALDVWEHAYYLKYQNKRADYINAWWNVINWEQAEVNFNKVF